jgi:hypothetical protein
MTTITNTEALTGPSTTISTTTIHRPSRALAARRGFLIASPVLAGLFLLVGAIADPASGISGTRMFEIYADNPGPLQFKSLGYKWAYAFWIAPALLAVPYVRARGSALATLAGFVGFGGLTTMPGLLLVDWYDSAIGQLYGVEGVTAVQDRMTDTMWGVQPFLLPGMVGLFLGLPLITAALWRARLARWWALAASVAAMVAFMVSAATWWGAAIAAVFLAVVAVALAKATRPQE